MNLLKGNDFSSRVWVARACLLLAGALFAMGLAPSAIAGTIYTYTGNDYNDCGGIYCTGGPYALAVVFETTLAGNALVNLPFTDITGTITSYDFTDGTGLTFNNINNTAAQLDIEMATDGSGNIVAWFVGAYSFPAEIQMQTNWNSPVGFIPGADFSETTSGFAGDFGFLYNDPGIWSMQASVVPEPSAFALLGTGMVALMIGLSRRGRRGGF